MSAKQVQVGDKVKVITEINGHQFPIGSWVEVYKINPEFAYCQDDRDNQYGLTANEFETLN
jgi:hypothetical protein